MSNRYDKSFETIGDSLVNRFLSRFPTEISFVGGLFTPSKR